MAFPTKGSRNFDPVKRTWLKLSTWILAILVGIYGQYCIAQTPKNEVRQYHGSHILLTTDVSPSDEVAQLTQAFDAGVQIWTKLFNADPDEVKSWKVDAYLMTSRERFENAGLVDRSIREFREGHQQGDLILCKDQSSEYYRRHLLLHEGVHWFMEKTLGGYGPGWWMEGIAEWQSTHRWENQVLTCGVMPRTKEELPYWGRLLWIREDIQSGQAPSLGVLFRKAKALHRVDSTYGWSWMAATFFANHPRYKDAFYKRLTEPTDFSDALNRDVLSWIGDDMEIVQAEFNGFVTEMDYGVDPASVIIDLKAAFDRRDANVKQLDVDASKAWQLFPLETIASTKYEFKATGLIVLAEAPQKLESEPQGITLRYHAGKPIGQLIIANVPKRSSLELTIPWNRFTVGKGTSLTPNVDSYILVRVNNSNSDMASSHGSFHVTSN